MQKPKNVKTIKPISDIEQYKLTRKKRKRDKAANSKMKRVLSPRQMPKEQKTCCGAYCSEAGCCVIDND